MTPLRRPFQRTRGVRGQVDRQGVLHRLRVQIDPVEFHVPALEAHLPVFAREQVAKGLQDLVQHPAPMGGPLPRPDRLEFLPVATEPEAEEKAAVAELIQRGRLLREHHRLADGRDDHAGPELDATRGGGDAGQRDHQFVPVRRRRVREGVRRKPYLLRGGRVHQRGRGGEIETPQRIVAEPFRFLRETDDLGRSGELRRDEESLHAVGQRNVEPHRSHLPGSKMRTRAQPVYGTVSGRSRRERSASRARPA